ncbi:hypothetical protein MMMDOFMJ_4096 [Methylobacterium gnaphalii]|nr:hypothetical protein MMMDOFMJ_4096 [Methylobacterium gnaphalii]
MNVISGLPAFLAYFAAAIVLVALYILVYITATAHREMALIRAGNTAAALSLGASLIGYALPLSVAIRNAQSILDCIVWGLVALVVQILIYWLVRFILPDPPCCLNTTSRPRSRSRPRVRPPRAGSQPLSRSARCGGRGRAE